MKVTKPQKRRRSGSSSDDDEVDPEIQRQLEARLAAHCEKAMSKFAKPRKIKPSSVVPADNDAPAVDLDDSPDSPELNAIAPGAIAPGAPGARAAKKARRRAKMNAANAAKADAQSFGAAGANSFLSDVLGDEQATDIAQANAAIEVQQPSVALAPKLKMDAQLRKNYMSSKINKVRNWDRVDAQGEDKLYTKPLEETFKSLAQEVMELGAAQFVGRDKRVSEAHRLASLGAKMAKSPKMPIRMMEKMTKSLAKRNDKLREQCNQTGAKFEPQAMLSVMRGTQGEVRMKQRQAEGRKRDAGMKTGLGSYKNGVLTLKQADLTGIRARVHKEDTRKDNMASESSKGGKGKDKGGKGKGGKGKGGKGKGGKGKGGKSKGKGGKGKR